MEYDKFMKGCGFWMRRSPNTRSISIFNWGHLISYMVYDSRIEIWRNLPTREIPNAEALFTNSTPKLRKMMRISPTPPGEGE